MEIKRLKDEIEMNIQSRSINYSPRYVDTKDKPAQTQGVSTSNNYSIMKSMEKNNLDVKKYQMLNYIAELQREKIMPLN